ncbi:hypothetical protein PAPYR_13288 [Paratrimastix pyriformis]|uniref:Uncharacterized protein n=1 Tax=Paratrimastix pyriformis TaxID=342808 RepID=A0ABQ8U401_9EUKA|nr:hypothetical protein PAPYR_13288 [Paratrimastix pyriformis]
MSSSEISSPSCPPLAGVCSATQPGPPRPDRVPYHNSPPPADIERWWRVWTPEVTRAMDVAGICPVPPSPAPAFLPALPLLSIAFPCSLRLRPLLSQPPPSDGGWVHWGGLQSPGFPVAFESAGVAHGLLALIHSAAVLLADITFAHVRPGPQPAPVLPPCHNLVHLSDDLFLVGGAVKPWGVCGTALTSSRSLPPPATVTVNDIVRTIAVGPRSADALPPLRDGVTSPMLGLAVQLLT